MNCEELLEPSEVGRMLNLSAARVRGLALEGRLTVAARTQRGLRLFRREDVENYRRTIQRLRGFSPAEVSDFTPRSAETA